MFTLTVSPVVIPCAAEVVSVAVPFEIDLLVTFRTTGVGEYRNVVALGTAVT